MNHLEFQFPDLYRQILQPAYLSLKTEDLQIDYKRLAYQMRIN